MSVPEFSVGRPVTILTATAAITLFGLLAFVQLPLELLPDLSYPTLTVQTEYLDAAPTSVEQFISRPLEESVGVISGLRSLRSVSRAGLSEVILEFEWMKRWNSRRWMRERRSTLLNCRAKPLALESCALILPWIRSCDWRLRATAPLDELRQIADRWLRPRLESIRGVAAARVRGGLTPEIVVEVDIDRLAARGLTMNDVASALRSDNVNRPGGTLKDWGSVYLIRTLNEFQDLEQLRKTIVREGHQGRVRVEDIATVSRGHKDRVEITRAEGNENHRDRVAQGRLGQRD